MKKMAKTEKDKEILDESSKDDSKENRKLSKDEKKQAKIDAKMAKAIAKKEELATQITDLKDQIASEENVKKKNKLRRKRDDLIAQHDGISKSKDGMTIPLAQNTKKTIKAVIAVVIVIAILFTYVATGAVRHGLMSYFGAPQSSFTAYTIKDGNGNKHRVKVSTYNYYFALTYNNIRSTQSTYEQYGLDLSSLNLDVDFDEKLSKQTTTNDDGDTVTWAQYIQDQVMESIKSTYMYYYEAVAANDGVETEITEDQQTELDDTLSDYTETAEGYGYTLSGYLKAAMGKGVSEAVFRREAKISYIAENYQDEYQDELSAKEYSDEEYDAYKEENYDDLVSVDVRLFECSNEDDAKAFAKALKSDASNFASLASKYSDDDWDKTANKDDIETTYNGITRPTLKNLSFAIATADDNSDEDEESSDSEETYSGLDWLYSKDRKAGDVKQYSTTVVYVVKPVYLSDQKTVNVRHILIKPVDEDDEDAEITEMSDELWEEAYDKAKSLLDEWKDGDATAESFGELAKENTDDSNGDDGGLYENVVPNQMVNSFNAWCFDSSRKAGDTGIVKTEYGYHVIYFESVGNLSVWQYTAQQALASDDSTDTIAELEDSYTIKTNWFGSRYFEKDTDIDS
jgi:parvulin-like peptidyl-prolyl isomerase